MYIIKINKIKRFYFKTGFIFNIYVYYSHEALSRLIELIRNNMWLGSTQTLKCQEKCQKYLKNNLTDKIHLQWTY